MQTQTVHKQSAKGIDSLVLPGPNERVKHRLQWGRVDVLFTPAFWAAQVFLNSTATATLPPQRFGGTFREEVIACLLCTHGMPSEVGLAAYNRMRDENLLDPERATPARVAQVLTQPLRVGNRAVRYRFPNQKARAVCEAVRRTGDHAPSLVPSQLRAFLQSLYGIGPKVASWITRNYLATEAVAVIDIHVYRAGVETGFLTPTRSIERDYSKLELDYLDFALALGVSPTKLDGIIWQTMRVAPRGRGD